MFFHMFFFPYESILHTVKVYKVYISNGTIRNISYRNNTICFNNSSDEVSYAFPVSV